MDGTVLLDALKKHLAKKFETAKISDVALASALDLPSSALVTYRGKNLTPAQVVRLMEKYANAQKNALIDSAVIPIVEFFPLEPIKSTRSNHWQLFSTADDHPYLRGLRTALEEKVGIYVFHDSRGRAIYAGKTVQQSLWKEMENAFNRGRKEVQTIKRVSHPHNRVVFRGADEVTRKITKESVELHHIAAYISAYQIAPPLIGKFEALIIRAFANDLLNVRMETI